MRISVLTAVALGMTAPVAFAGSLKHIVDETEFRTYFVGKTMVWKGGSQITHEDGSVTGTIPAMGGAFTGTWAWQDGLYCRNLVIQGNETGTDCIKIESDGTTARLTRDQGRGRVYDVTLE